MAGISYREVFDIGINEFGIPFVLVTAVAASGLALSLISSRSDRQNEQLTAHAQLSEVRRLSGLASRPLPGEMFPAGYDSARRLLRSNNLSEACAGGYAANELRYHESLLESGFALDQDAYVWRGPSGDVAFDNVSLPEAAQGALTSRVSLDQICRPGGDDPSEDK